MEIDLEDLRQMLWEDPRGRPKDDLNEQQIDKVRWIDTSTMLADQLTKVMSPDRLVKSLDGSQIDLTPTAASTIAKMMKQRQRRKTKDDDHLLDDIGMTYDPNYVDLGYGEEDLQTAYDHHHGYQEGVAHFAQMWQCIGDKSHECDTTLGPEGDVAQSPNPAPYRGPRGESPS